MLDDEVDREVVHAAVTYILEKFQEMNVSPYALVEDPERLRKMIDTMDCFELHRGRLLRRASNLPVLRDAVFDELMAVANQMIADHQARRVH